MSVRDIGFVVGRVLVGIFYIWNGINHFTNLKGLAQYAEGKGVPAPELAVFVTGLLLLGAGLSFLLGIFPSLGVLLLVIFYIPVTFWMHAFWTVEDPTWRMVDRINFFKNMALLGSALMLLAIPEPWKMSVKLGKREST